MGIEKAHPFSRKAKQVRRAYAREERLSKIKTIGDEVKTRVVDRLVWFKYALPDDVEVATPEIVHDLIDQYINRNNDEIEALRATIRPNRPKPAKLELYNMLMGKDRHEYRTGMKLPDLLNAANVVKLRRWEGDYNGMQAIKMVTVLASTAPGGIKPEVAMAEAVADADTEIGNAESDEDDSENED
ncbi:hypothetical protein HK100_011934 [Physocladia obscura]|uniref:Uncharacterized protein n=1 Tax=Physocladia obscura TaxID=109957 RepID=A0AAD5XHM0_9FUNG|nr:hypothetical protein HK100_011934 [Physocladia obscura]